MDGSFFGSFWTRIVFPFIIHLRMLAFCKHLLFHRGRYSWMDVNLFLEPNVFTRLVLAFSNLAVSSESLFASIVYVRYGTFFKFFIVRYQFSILCSILFHIFHFILYEAVDLYLCPFQQFWGRIFCCYFGKASFVSLLDSILILFIRLSMFFCLISLMFSVLAAVVFR